MGTRMTQRRRDERCEVLLKVKRFLDLFEEVEQLSALEMQSSTAISKPCCFRSISGDSSDGLRFLLYIGLSLADYTHLKP